MSIVITDPALIAALDAATGTVDLTDPSGRFLATVTLPYGKLPPGVESPFTEEELAERRKQRDGRPLADILRDLKEKYGS
jgi:hypothetical protein